MVRSWSALAALALAAAALPAAAEEYVVIDSSLPALAVGATLTSGATLDIPSQNRVVLMTAGGKVMALNGPFRGSPPASGSAPGAGVGGDVLKIVPTLLGAADQHQEIGAVRAIDPRWRDSAVKTADEALAIDASEGGDMCVYDPGHAAVIHNPDDSGTMTVQSMTNGAQAALSWDKGALRQPWPASLPLNDGDMFSFQQPGASQVSMATIHVLPPPAGAGDVERALQMAQAGCADQARLLLAVIAKSAK